MPKTLGPLFFFILQRAATFEIRAGKSGYGLLGFLCLGNADATAAALAAGFGRHGCVSEGSPMFIEMASALQALEAATAPYESEDMVCSQEILCTADFVTPVEQQFAVDFNAPGKNMPMPVSLTPLRTKRPRNAEELLEEQVSAEDAKPLAPMAIRQRVMSPPCVRNPFVDSDFAPPKARQACRPGTAGSSSTARYHEEFHQIQEIGRGNFSCVYKVLKRLDGCLYAVKRSNKPLHQEGERKRALREVQALACLGYHDNVVRYFSSWFENDHLYIQMELCEATLRDEKFASLCSEKLLLEAMWQLLNALKHLHSHGLVHLDLKPDNIYVRNGVYKLGDFGSASRTDGSLCVEDGDARYLPMEIINDDHTELEKADMFSLGATFYELARGSPLTSSGSQFHAIRQGKLALLPGFSLAFQNLIKSLMHPNPGARPTAAEALKNSLFRRGTSL